MARFARLIVPGYPHHVTQRGVRSVEIFANDEDRFAYLEFMKEESLRFGVSFVTWCLMTNHVHLIAIPEVDDSLARAIGEAHRRYTRRKNFAEGVRGYLFLEKGIVTFYFRSSIRPTLGMNILIGARKRGNA